MTDQPKFIAYLHVRDLATDGIVRSIGLTSLNASHVKKVIDGVTNRMNLDDYYVDDSEVAEMREVAK